MMLRSGTQYEVDFSCSVAPSPPPRPTRGAGRTVMFVCSIGVFAVCAAVVSAQKVFVEMSM
jgi:hypothetical protein